MMKRHGWVLWVFLAVACGGKARGDGSSIGGAEQTGAGGDNANGGAATTGNSGAGNSTAGNAGSCPDNLPSAEPSEGAACPTPGVSCSGYGSLSCPLTAVCGPDSKWQINCPSAMAFGPCSCPHHDYGRAPNEHRATAPSCSHTRAASIPVPDDNCPLCPNSECNRDSDCADSALGSNGRCVQRGPLPGYTCSYDTCFTDSACAKGSVCQCREPAGGVDANYCTTPSNCRVDADCGKDGYCSPSQSHEWCGTFYACHTPNDECASDSDCGTDTHCDFDTDAMHWVCGNLCGAVPP
ncbi:MAG: hypothetical protein WDO69_08890 [Pseudomonadota bacterium]